MSQEVDFSRFLRELLKSFQKLVFLKFFKTYYTQFYSRQDLNTSIGSLSYLRAAGDLPGTSEMTRKVWKENNVFLQGDSRFL